MSLQSPLSVAFGDQPDSWLGKLDKDIPSLRKALMQWVSATPHRVPSFGRG